LEWQCLGLWHCACLEWVNLGYWTCEGLEWHELGSVLLGKLRKI
jgi:hypothetical protein